MANIIPDSFKEQLLSGTHDFTPSTGDAFKLALYTTASAFSSTGTTNYVVTNEASGTGYTAGGAALESTTLTVSNNVALVDFSDLTFTTATIAASAALIYNSTQGDKAVVVLDFDGTKTSTNGDFTIQFPAPTSTTAILRIS